MKRPVLSKERLIILLPAAAALIAVIICRSAFCGRLQEEPQETISITGTWIDADSWENGVEDAVFLEFDSSGSLFINHGNIPRLYKYEDSLLTIYFPELDTNMQTECSVTGGFMRLDPRVRLPGMPHGTIDFIHISESVGLSSDELHDLYIDVE